MSIEETNLSTEKDTSVPASEPATQTNNESNNTTSSQITDEDRMMYFAAITELIPYTKTFSLNDGFIEITFRTISDLERDLCLAYQMLVNAPRDIALTYIGYAAISLQTIRIKIGDKLLIFPKTLREWIKHLKEKYNKDIPENQALKYIVDEFRTNINDSPELLEIINYYLIQFNNQVKILKEEVRNQNFFKIIRGLKS